MYKIVKLTETVDGPASISTFVETAEDTPAVGLAVAWGTLYDPGRRHFIGLGERSPIVRYLPLPRSRSALLVEPLLRVLALLASPAGLAPLDMDREWQAIEDALRGLENTGQPDAEKQQSPALSVE